MKKGTIKWYNKDKFYGFLTPEEGGGDVFFHGSELKDDVQEGDNVSYTPKEGKKGIQATNVKIID